MKKELKEGDSYKEEVSYTAEQVKLFAEVSGDKNPVHLSKEFAATTPFKKPIVPGMLASSTFSKVIATNFPGPGAIYLEKSISFLNPLYPGEKYIVSITVSNKRITSKGHTIYKMDLLIKDKENKVMLKGTATVMH